MAGNGERFTRATWRRLRGEVSALVRSDAGHPSVVLFGLLIGALLVINLLNVVNSYVGRDFISAIEHKDPAAFVRQAWAFVGVFALSALAAMAYRYFEERLGLLWREWQTRRLLDRYLARNVYVRIEQAQVVQNPDQRIAEDVRSFTATTLSFVLMALNALLTMVAFAGVLWSISPQLFGVAIAYAAVGSLLTSQVGRRLVGLTSAQLDREADFRAELLRVRENAEAVALLHREPLLAERLEAWLRDLVTNSRRVIGVHRNLGFFTSSYNYLIQIIPALIVAPLFMHGDVEFGVVTQAAMAFSQLMGAFSLAVTQFESISAYAAVVGRLGRLVDAIDDPVAAADAPLRIRQDPARIAFEHVTLRRADGAVLVRDLDVAIPAGTRTLVTSTSGHTKVALLEAMAGLYRDGEGTIVRPGPLSMMFLPERPYLPRATLRELVAPAGEGVSDERIVEILRELQLAAVVLQAGGLDVEHDWSARLGAGEQAAIGIARVILARPDWVFLDRLTIAFDAAQAERVLDLLTAHGIAYLKVGKPGDAIDRFDARLAIEPDGRWCWIPVEGTGRAAGPRARTCTPD